MIFEGSVALPSGGAASFHRVRRVELLLEPGLVAVHVDSWGSRAGAEGGYPPESQVAHFAIGGDDGGAQGLVAFVAQRLVAQGAPLAGAIEAPSDESLESLKARKVAALRTTREAVVDGGFVWDGSTFDSDQVSQTRLLGLRVEATSASYTPKTWRLADNSWRMLSATDALAVWDALRVHIETAFLRFAQREAAVATATTAEEVDAVTW